MKGKTVLQDGNAIVLDHLKDDVVHIGSIIHSYPIDWRTKKPVLIKASQQWFINTSSLKDNAIREVCIITRIFFEIVIKLLVFHNAAD